MKIELWSGHTIRFVQVEGEWWAAAKDVASALGYRDAFNMVRHVEDSDKGAHLVSTPSGTQEMIIISKFVRKEFRNIAMEAKS